MAAHLPRHYRSAEITRVKGHAGTPGNESADALAGRDAERTSLAHQKLRISEKFREAKDKSHTDPQHHGTEEIPPPPLKKSCMDGTRNSIARTAAQVRTAHWRSAIYFKRIRKRQSDECWFYTKGVRMTRSHALLHCPNATLVAPRAEAWDGKDPGSIRVLRSYPRWEGRFLRFLEISGMGRTVDGLDVEEANASRLDGWIVWEMGEEGGRSGG
jgi:hypothetical protein